MLLNPVDSHTERRTVRRPEEAIKLKKRVKHAAENGFVVDVGRMK